MRGVGLAGLCWFGLWEAGVAVSGGMPPLKPVRELSAAVRQPSHDDARQAIREGDNRRAFEILANLRRREPESAAVYFDYVAAASWAGEDGVVLAEAGHLNLDTSPDYAVDALAVSAWRSGEPDFAFEAYGALLRREPERLSAHIGQIRVQISRTQYAQALARLRPLIQRYPDRLDLLELQALAQEGAQDFPAALSTVATILQRQPDNRFALRMRFHLLRRLGAPHLAKDLTPDDVLSELERVAVRSEQLAFEIRWAKISAETAQVYEHRWDALDLAIAQTRSHAETMAQSADSAVLARVPAQQFDLLVALGDRLRMQEAIALYETLAASESALPAYARLTAASAYLHNRQPDKARDLFAEALPEDKHNFNARLGYFYALLESEHYREAVEEADRLAADTPEWLHANLPGLRRINPDYPRAQTNAARARLYTDDLEDAQVRLEDLKERAPANTDIRGTLAGVYRMRGWPRQALADQRLQLKLDPGNTWAELGAFESNMDIADYPAAERHLQAAATALPNERPILRALRQWELHQRPEIYAEMIFGRSSDYSPYGNLDRQFDLSVYSSPLAYHWRLYAHVQYAYGEFPEGRYHRDSADAGVEYRSPEWRVNAALRSSDHKTGGALAATYRADDHRYYAFAYASPSLDTPLRANASGVTADRLSLAAGYRWNESRAVGASLATMNFDDGNRRNELNASASGQLVHGPVYRLTGNLDAYASNNSLPGGQAFYFNPSSDFSLGLTLDNQWVQFQRYERSLKHHLVFGLGNYWQENYGNGAMTSVHYVQEFTPDDALYIKWGIGTGVHPYDGQDSRRDVLYGTLDWKF